MTSQQLPNYLHANRKRLALSQAEVAFLLGVIDDGKVCRYERFARAPTLEAALACEVIFQRPMSELFAGTYQRVEAKVAARAKVLAQRKGEGEAASRKRRIFTSLAKKAFITNP